MGERGPAPKATITKIRNGNRGHEARLMENYNREPQPPPAIPPCPEFLDPVAQAEWRRIAPHLKEEQLLTHIDRATLAAYCQCWARWQQAEAVIETEGLTITGPTGWVQPAPAVGISLKMLTAMKGYAVQLGLSPSARSRIQIDVPKTKTAADPLEEKLA